MTLACKKNVALKNKCANKGIECYRCSNFQYFQKKS